MSQEQKESKMKVMMREVRHLKAYQVLALEPTHEEVVSWVKAQMNGTWFTSHLLRLVSRSDLSNREKLRLAYPDEVELFVRWYK